jgi:hypothetical protein
LFEYLNLVVKDNKLIINIDFKIFIIMVDNIYFIIRWYHSLMVSFIEIITLIIFKDFTIFFEFFLLFLVIPLGIIIPIKL